MSDHLLPPNSTAFERALAGTTKQLYRVPIPIDTIKDAQEIPAALLPWLGWEFSIDVWENNWPEDKKRALIDRWFHLHRHKGTLNGIADHIQIAGGELLRAIRPPIKIFGGRSTTPEEHQAFLNRFPQLRIYRFRERGIGHPRAQFATSHCFAGYHVPHKSNSAKRTGTRVFLWDKGSHPLATGEETELSWRSISEDPFVATQDGYDEISVKHYSPRLKQFCRSFAGTKMPMKSTAESRMLQYRLTTIGNDQSAYRMLRAAAPSLTPIDLKAEDVKEFGEAMFGSQFAGQCLRKKFLPPTTAYLRTYSRLYLHDKRRAPTSRGARTFAGRQRIGMKPFSAELLVQIRGRKPVYRHFAGGFVGQVPGKQDQSKLTSVKRAVVSSKAMRDRILLDTATVRPRTFGDGYLLDGSLKMRSTVSVL